MMIVADRYAAALFDLAVSAGDQAVESIDADLALVTQTLSENLDLRRLLEHPLVSRQDKHGVIASLFEPHVGHYTGNFLKLLVDRNRWAALDVIAERFHQMAAKRARKVTVSVATAVPIDPAQLQQFREQLEQDWQRRIEFEAQVDPSILGGAVMRVEDQIIDGSIRGRLAALEQALLQG